MTKLVLAFVALATAIPAQQDIIYYKFEENAGDLVTNFATHIDSPGEGMISSGPASAWGPGRFGSGGLAAGPYLPFSTGTELDTGWDSAVPSGDDLTVAFFFHAGTAPPVGLNTVCGTQPGIGVSIASWPLQYGYVRLNWYPTAAGGPVTIFPADALTPALAGWAHVAIVVDRGPTNDAVITLYIDGVQQTPSQTGVGYGDLPGSSQDTLKLAEDNYFDYDEFRVCRRAASSAEILDWATIDRAVEVSFGDPCVPFGQVAILTNITGTLPQIGNANYGVSFFAPYGSQAALVLGFDRTNPRDLGSLAHPALSGCLLHPDQGFPLQHVTMPPVGRIDFAFPVPNDPALVGLVLYAQAVGLNPWTMNWFSTNAFAASVGN